MKYDHSRKAGNRGDVWKHAVLVALADKIPAPSDTAKYVDCHSGAPEHELRRGGEWETGVGAATRHPPDACDYAKIAAQWVRSNKYPAGWVFVVNRLARRFRIVYAALSDLDARVAARYSKQVSGIPSNVVVEFQQVDGFAAASRVERADLVFLDPPFHPDAEADWRALAGACQGLAQRGVPFVAWYPLYWPTRPQGLVDTTKCAAWEVSWRPCGSKPSEDLKGCGMLASDNLVPAMRIVESKLRRVSGWLGAELLVRTPQAV